LIIAIPEALREKLGPEGARALAEMLDEASVQTGGDAIEIAASQSRRELAEEFEALRADMRAFEARLLRLMFLLSIGYVGALVGILFAFFRT
jgi:hypothetical protein